MKIFPALFNFKKKKYPLIVPQGRHGMSRGDIEFNALDIMSRLRRFGHPTYLVGGCVRDILLGKTPKDFDIVTGARPQQIKRLFRRCFLIGRRFRLAHVYVSHDRFIEVATFRARVDPDEVPEGGRFAENNVYGTIDDDALRRDFTVNALYYNGADGSIVDYCGGLEDLNKRILRSIGQPAARFREDPVRIIRAARFCAQLGFNLSKQDLKAAVASAPLIKEANGHRLLEELYKILRCGSSADTLLNLKCYGILSHWLPDLAPEKYHDRVIARLKAVDRRRLKGDEIPTSVLLASLFYDLFEEAMGSRRGFQEAFEALNRQFNEMTARLRIPRREWDAISNMTARLAGFTRIPDGKKGKAYEKRFLHNVHFRNSLMFFEIVAEATGEHGEALRYWQRRAAELPAHKESAGGEGAEPAAGGRRKRPRRRRGPRGGAQPGQAKPA